MKKSIHRTFFHFFGFEASAAHYLQIGIYEQTTCKSLKAPGINFLVAQLETEARQGELRFLMAATLSISDRNPVTGRTRWRERGKEIFGNLAVRHGIKFGIAGMLSVFLALLIRLPEPTWALITVFVVMLAQFVGAVAEKSVMRIIGTVAGGVIGYLLTAGLEQQPVLYVLLVGSVVGFGTAMFGYTKYPYAFLLCALTTMVVASNGMNDPAFSWQPALWRVVEVCVGVIAAVLVTSLLWPRYARKEFMEKMRLALEELRKGSVALCSSF